MIDFNRPFVLTEAPILIRSNRDPYGWLGNMSPFPVTYEGKEYRTTEALFQALRVSDEETRELIRAEKNPMGAKFKAKSLAHMRTVTPLSEADRNLMRLCLKLKIERHTQLRHWLIQTGASPIVEDCTKRQRGTGLFWGAALLSEDELQWTGMNWLGRLWEELRDKTQLEQLGLDDIFGM